MDPDLLTLSSRGVRLAVVAPCVFMSVNFTPIAVAQADDSWPDEFCRRADALRDALGPVAQRVDHVGSTAVPGLDAKPTIDIQVSVDSLEDLESFRGPIERLGYTFHERSLADVEHRFFSAPSRAAHIHVCPHGSSWERTHLLFRDYLRNHPEAQHEYARLKHQLAGQHRNDREAYTAAKAQFIQGEMTEAEVWARNVGWTIPNEDLQ